MRLPKAQASAIICCTSIGVRYKMQRIFKIPKALVDHSLAHTHATTRAHTHTHAHAHTHTRTHTCICTHTYVSLKSMKIVHATLSDSWAHATVIALIAPPSSLPSSPPLAHPSSPPSQPPPTNHPIPRRLTRDSAQHHHQHQHPPTSSRFLGDDHGRRGAGWTREEDGWNDPVLVSKGGLDFKVRPPTLCIRLDFEQPLPYPVENMCNDVCPHTRRIVGDWVLTTALNTCAGS